MAAAPVRTKRLRDLQPDPSKGGHHSTTSGIHDVTSAHTGSDDDNNAGSTQSQSPIPAARAPTTAASSASSVAEPPSMPLAPSPKAPPRKVRRQASTAAHLAEKGLPGFAVRRVTVHRPEGEGLGLSIVPSCGATRYYYQVSGS